MEDIKLLIRNMAISILLTFLLILACALAYAIIYFIFAFCPFLLVITLLGAIAGVIYTAKKGIDLWRN